ncbi:MAG: restriction endonuclease, partial [Rhizobiales bacterium]|nr:restriction endonuclease [Hyphomicrobiales bacterium]
MIFYSILDFINELSLFDIIAPLVVVVILALNLLHRYYYPPHATNIRTANKLLLLIKSMATEDYGRARIFRYLRKISPYIFEEMVLTAIQNKGHTITRSKSYSGDGGINGQCKIDGEIYLIQSKRYKGHINRKHVMTFDRLCHSKDVFGLFVHTGKTGGKSHSKHFYNIDMISGDRLLKLLLDEPLDL